MARIGGKPLLAVWLTVPILAMGIYPCKPTNAQRFSPSAANSTDPTRSALHSNFSAVQGRQSPAYG